MKELTLIPQWVGWTDRKIPMNPWTGTAASSTDPETWAPLSKARSAARKHGWEGVGFVFTKDDPYIGIDLDNCLLEDGRATDWAKWILDNCSSYAEISPSGNGLKIFCTADDIQDLSSVKEHDFPVPGSGIEVYSHSRYFTVTFQQWPEAPSKIRDCSSGLQRLLDRIQEHRGAQKKTSVAPPPATFERERCLKEAQQYVSAIPGAAEGGRSNAAFGVAASIVNDKNLGDDPEAFAILESWNERCSPPLGWSELSKIWQSALKNAKYPAGCKVTEKPRSKSEGYPLTDEGNAQILFDLHGEDLRWVTQWKAFLVWTGKVWQRDDDATLVYQRYKDVIKKRDSDISVDDKEAKRLARWAQSTGMARTFENTLKMFRRKVLFDPGRLDANPWLLNFENGTVNLKNGVVSNHNREDYLSKILPFPINKEAVCPRWRQFVGEVMAEDPELVAFIQRWLGYNLCGSTKESSVCIFWGSGSNGKSTLLETLLKAMGPYGNKTSMQTFLHSHRNDPGSPTPHLAALKGARMVIASEAEEGKRLNEALLKELTGGDTIYARELRRDPIQFRPEFKITMLTNHRPHIRGQDHGIWRRLLLVPFEVQFKDGDPDLPSKLEREIPGILLWAIEGCLLWQKEGLKPPQKVMAATQSYREEEDPLFDFLRERMELRPTEHGGKSARELANLGYKTSISDLYSAFQTWCDENTEIAAGRWSKRRFQSKMQERSLADGRVFWLHRFHKGHAWVGIKPHLLGSRTEVLGSRTAIEAWSEVDLSTGAVDKSSHSLQSMILAGSRTELGSRTGSRF